MSMFDTSFNLGSPTANTFATGVDVYAQSLGFDPSISGALGSSAGNFASAQLGTLPSTSASLGTPASTNSATQSTNTGTASLWDTTKCWLNAWTVGDMQKCANATQAGVDSVNNSPVSKITFAGVATALVGIGLIVAAMYLFGSSQLSNAISSAVKGK